MGNANMSDERDIVERLRDYDTCHDGVVDEAANEIERLRAELRRMDARMDDYREDARKWRNSQDNLSW
jgi:predicted RNase H-like nuclease (RuvC/YqgF family)